MIRTQISKLTRGHSTKSERVFLEILKELRIPFRAKVIINNREVDFLIGKYAIEINGHPQKTDKNGMLLESGYIPINYDNNDILKNREEIKNEIKQLCLDAQQN